MLPFVCYIQTTKPDYRQRSPAQFLEYNSKVIEWFVHMEGDNSQPRINKSELQQSTFDLWLGRYATF